MEDKTIKKILYLVIILFTTYYLLFNHIYMKINAKSSDIDDYTIEDIRHMIECENRLEVFSEDGSIELMESQVIDDTGIEQPDSSYLERTSFDEVKILDSGKPDNQSIVMTIMGDGFTSTEQAAFVNAATNVVHYLLGDDSAGTSGFYPYNLFKDYFTIYAIKVISEESGVSRDADTNNGHIVNNYFGSSFYYGNDTSTIQRALVITKENKARALKKPYSSITTIICNSSRWGGTGGCVNGGGQPIVPSYIADYVDVRKERAKVLYDIDKDAPLRKSHENPFVIECYKEFLGEPNSELAHHLLHTHYTARKVYELKRK